MVFRDSNGRLMLDGVRETSSGLLDRPTEYSKFLEPLTSSEVDKLNQILPNPCFSGEPSASYDKNIVVGGTFVVLEAATPEAERRMIAYGKMPGVNGELLDLIYEAANRGTKRSAPN